MKRSEINELMRKSLKLLDDNCFKLPPFAYWSPADWATKGKEADEIRDCMLGWDLTDFGLGTFRNKGLTMFTLRNGHYTNAKYAHKPYCEKILISDEDQICLMHFHWKKVEDIIVRAGGNLVVQIYNATDDDQLADTPVRVSLDGIETEIPAGGTVTLHQGESICLPSRLYHKFWAEKGTGTALLGEVSKVNDDTNDNRFHEDVGRFPTIEEDEEPLHLLFSEYPPAN